MWFARNSIYCTVSQSELVVKRSRLGGSVHPAIREPTFVDPSALSSSAGYFNSPPCFLALWSNDDYDV